MAGVTSGTTTRFTAGEMSASRPNEASTTGSVAACAARETPRLSLNQRGSRPRVRRSSRSVSGVAHATSPAVASVDSWNPASLTSAGSASSSRNAARPSAAACPAASAGLPGEEDHPGHRTGTEHGWRGPGEHDVRDDRDGGDDRSSSTPEPTGHRPDRGRHDRDVPARDRDDVTDAGGREVGRDLPVDAIAQADEDARGEPRLGFGEDAGQQLAGIAAPTLQQRAWIDRAAPAPPSNGRRGCPTRRVARGIGHRSCPVSAGHVPPR